MTSRKVIALLVGLAMLAGILSHTDLHAVARDMARIGVIGGAAIVATFAVGFAADVGSWLFLFRSVMVSRLWTFRLWLVQMVGEGLNVLAPFGPLGGEPFKALLLKRHYNVSYPEGAASLVLIQTVNSLAEVPFVVIGVAFLLQLNVLPAPLQFAVIAAVVTVTLFMALVIGLVHFRALAVLEKRLSRGRWGDRLARALVAIKEVEEHLFHVMRRTPGKFAAAFALAFVNWMFGALELFLIFSFLHHPISGVEAWAMEAVVVLVRSGTFFIPAHLGAQEGAIALLAGALTGSPEIGFAAALVRRAREFVWSAAGLGIGAWFGFRKPTFA